MTPAYLVFLTFMTLALVLMIAGYIRVLFFAKRWRLLAEAGLNPVKGVILWKRIFTRNGFGEKAEPGRRSVARLYYSAVLAFIVAILLFFVLPGMPN
jgi:hypothetical protein